MRSHAHSIKHALNGIIWGFQTQPNYRIHFALSLLTISTGYFLQVTYEEWLILLVMITLGFVIETINTAIERVGDAIDTKYNENIKLAKDSAAGAMLLFSIGAIIVAAWIFLPKIVEFLK